MILIDTTVWSLALRRRKGTLNSAQAAVVSTWADLIREGTAALMGPIRQEILSGLRQVATFRSLQEQLDDFPHVSILPKDYDQAAHFFNTCRTNGVTGTAIDMLICAVAHRTQMPIFTTDKGFKGYAKHVSISLFQTG